MATKLDQVMNCNEHEELPVKSHMRYPVRLRAKLNMLYLHFHGTNDYQKWPASDILWGASTHKVIGSFNHMLN